jgi:hypothetical protein
MKKGEKITLSYERNHRTEYFGPFYVSTDFTHRESMVLFRLSSDSNLASDYFEFLLQKKFISHMLDLEHFFLGFDDELMIGEKDLDV